MKKVVIALVLGMLIGSATTALAAAGEITAVFAQFALKINGQDKQLETTPLVYNGTSYLPVREMANLVGYDVTYKADSRTIELNSASAVTTVTRGPAPAPQPAPTSTTIPPSKGEMNMSEWISVRELAEKNGAIVGFNPNLTISNDQLTIEFDFTTQTLAGRSSDTPHNEISRDGRVNFMVYQGTSYIKITDAKNVGLLPQ